MNAIPPVREDLIGIAPYGAPTIDVPARLNVNENPYPMSPTLSAALGEAVAQIAPTLHRYPDREASALRTALAGYLMADGATALTAAQVWVANGSNEVMHHIFAAFGGPGRAALTFTPTYSMYPEYARETFTRLIERPRRSDFAVDIDDAREQIAKYRPSIVVVASPNNPTGTTIAMADLRTLAAAAQAQQALLVVDEAYAEFRHDGVPSALTLLDDFPNVIVTRTMSKAFAMAGARVGYAAANADIIDALRIVRLPYHLSAVTQVVAATALEHADELMAQVDAIRTDRDALAVWLAHHGYEVVPSDANFLLFGPFADRHAVWQELVDRGVLIRETGPPGFLRVSIGTPAENAMFTTALADIASEGSP